MMDLWARWLLTHRGLVALAVFIVTVLAGWSALRLEFDDQPRELFRRNDADFAQLEQLVDDFGPDDGDVMLVIDGGDLFTPAVIRAIWKLVERLGDCDAVSQVQSIVSIRRQGSRLAPLLPYHHATWQRCEEARARALKHPMVAGQFLSRDGTTMLMLVRLREATAPMSIVEPAVYEIRDIARELLVPLGRRVRMAGHPAIRVDLINNTRRERSRFTVLSALVASIIALFVFRRPAAILMCVAGPAVGVLWTLGVLGLFGERINVLGTIIPSLLFVIGFTDSVHMVSNFRRQCTAGASAMEAARVATAEVGIACALTSVTTSVAFGSLCLAELDVVQRFGISCACGTALTFLAVVTVIPILCSTRLGSLAVSRPVAVGGDGKANSRVSTFWSHILLAHPKVIAVTGIAISVYLASISVKLRPDIRWTESLSESSQTRQVSDHCDRVFGGSLPAYIVIEWPDDATIGAPDVRRLTSQVYAAIRAEPLLSEPFSFANVAASLSRNTPWERALHRLPARLTGQLVHAERRRLVVTFRVPDVGAAHLEPVFQRMEQQVDRLRRDFPGYQLWLTGTSVVAARNVHRMIGDLARSLSATAVIVFAIMAIAFRSLVTGALAIVPNAFPLLFTSGCIQLSGQPLQIVSVLTFSLCLGLAVDDTIHFIVRYQRELALDGDRAAAIQRTLQAVGFALIITSVVLIGGFSVVLWSELPPLRSFAQLSCTALLAALAGDLVLLPAFLVARRPTPS